MTITVSTDGSALGNPNGPMGWAWADHHDSESDASSCHHHVGDCDAGGATNGTNQIGELCAVLQALRAHPGKEPLVIESDSQYAINCSSKWVHGWKKNGWKNSQKKPVKNADVIRAIDREISAREGSVSFRWVKGHAGNAGNERVDMLARTYAEDCRSGVKDGYLPLEGWQSLLASEYANDDTDVPSDAQLLLDGAITAEDYVASHTQDPDMPVHSHKDNASAKDSASSKETISRKKTVSRETAERAQASTAMEQAPAVTEQPAATENPVAAKQPAPATKQSAATLPEKSVHIPSPTGITVSGTLRMAPAPSTSPTYDGSPRHVHGFIEIDGYVQADGSITIANLPFLV